MCKRGFYVEAVGGSGVGVWGAQPPDADKDLIISTLKWLSNALFTSMPNLSYMI